MHAGFLQIIWIFIRRRSTDQLRNEEGPQGRQPGLRPGYSLIAPAIPVASALYITTPFASHSAGNGRYGVALCFGSETYRVNGGLPAAREIQVARQL